MVRRRGRFWLRLVGCVAWPARSSSPRCARQSRRSAARHHAGRVRGVPARSRRLPRSRDRGGRARAGVQRHELRRLPQRAGGRRRRHHRRDARRAPRRRAASSSALDAIRRDAVPSLLGARRTAASRSMPPTMPRVRPPRADSALRRRARRSDSRRDDCSRSKTRSTATATA